MGDEEKIHLKVKELVFQKSAWKMYAIKRRKHIIFLYPCRWAMADRTLVIQLNLGDFIQLITPKT